MSYYEWMDQFQFFLSCDLWSLISSKSPFNYCSALATEKDFRHQLNVLLQTHGNKFERKRKPQKICALELTNGKSKTECLKIRKFVWEKMSLICDYTRMGYFKNENSLPTDVSVRYVLCGDERESRSSCDEEKNDVNLLIRSMMLQLCRWGESWYPSMFTKYYCWYQFIYDCYSWRRRQKSAFVISIKFYMRFLFLRFSDHIFSLSCGIDFFKIENEKSLI